MPRRQLVAAFIWQPMRPRFGLGQERDLNGPPQMDGAEVCGAGVQPASGSTTPPYEPKAKLATSRPPKHGGSMQARRLHHNVSSQIPQDLIATISPFISSQKFSVIRQSNLRSH